MDIADAHPMELLSSMPVVHFKPTESKEKEQKYYPCPCYILQFVREVASDPSYVVTVDLKAGGHTPEFWVKRGLRAALVHRGLKFIFFSKKNLLSKISKSQ